jgi:hypothetical protein
MKNNKISSEEKFYVILWTLLFAIIIGFIFIPINIWLNINLDLQPELRTLEIMICCIYGLIFSKLLVSKFYIKKP